MTAIEAFATYNMNGVHSPDRVCDFVTANWSDFKYWQKTGQAMIIDNMPATLEQMEFVNGYIPL